MTNSNNNNVPSRWQDKTRGGFNVRIYSEDAGGEFPIHGAAQLDDDGIWLSRTWNVNGSFHGNGGMSEYDLLPVVQRRYKTNDELVASKFFKLTFWPDGDIVVYTEITKNYNRHADVAYNFTRADQEWLDIFTTECTKLAALREYINQPVEPKDLIKEK